MGDATGGWRNARASTLAGRPVSKLMALGVTDLKFNTGPERRRTVRVMFPCDVAVNVVRYKGLAPHPRHAYIIIVAKGLAEPLDWPYIAFPSDCQVDLEERAFPGNAWVLYCNFQ